MNEFKIKINEEQDNKFYLLINVIIKNSDIIGKCYETLEPFENKGIDFYNEIGKIDIVEIKRGKTWEDKIDGTETTIMKGKAHVGLNIYSDFTLTFSVGTVLLENYNNHILLSTCI